MVGSGPGDLVGSGTGLHPDCGADTAGLVCPYSHGTSVPIFDGRYLLITKSLGTGTEASSCCTLGGGSPGGWGQRTGGDRVLFDIICDVFVVLFLKI